MFNYVYDAGAQTLLRADGSAPVTGNSGDGPIDFSWTGNQAVAVVINVTDVDRADGDETYVFSVSSHDSAGANAVIQATLPSIESKGQYAILVDCDTARRFDTDAEQLGLTVAVGGASPSITYAAWLMPV